MSYYNNDQQEKQEFELEAMEVIPTSGLSSDYRLSLGSNPPDILAQNGKKKIGIEIRRIYADEGKGGSPKYRQRSLCEKIIDKSAELHQKRSNQPYVVDVQFNLQSIFYDKRVNEIAKIQ